LGESVHAIQEKIKALLLASKEFGLEIISDKSKHMFMSRDQNTVQNHSINFYNTLVEIWKCLNIWEQTQLNKYYYIIYIYIYNWKWVDTRWQ
jgi:hypothetical protein